MGVPSDSANSGEKAVHLLMRRLLAMTLNDTHPPFKLIILDFSMPGMSGPETARKMLELLGEFR